MKRTGLFILLFVIASSCSRLFFNDENEVIERNIDPSFSVVDITGIYNLVLIQDSANKLIVSGSNDADLITCLVINDTLKIDDGKKISFNTERNSLELHFTNIAHLITRDPVNLSNVDTIRMNNFRLWAIGEISEVNLTIEVNLFEMANSANTLGHLYFNGEADYAYFFNRYGSSIFADSLKCSTAVVINESLGDVYVNARDKIQAYIWGPGKIYYYGNPEIVIEEKKGKGELVPVPSK